MYIVYDSDGFSVFVGNSLQCADYLGTTVGSFYSIVSRIKLSKRKATRKGYKVYKV